MSEPAEGRVCEPETCARASVEAESRDTSWRPILTIDLSIVNDSDACIVLILLDTQASLSVLSQPHLLVELTGHCQSLSKSWTIADARLICQSSS